MKFGHKLFNFYQTSLIQNLYVKWSKLVEALCSPGKLFLCQLTLQANEQHRAPYFVTIYFFLTKTTQLYLSNRIHLPNFLKLKYFFWKTISGNLACPFTFPLQGKKCILVPTGNIYVNWNYYTVLIIVKQLSVCFNLAIINYTW